MDFRTIQLDRLEFSSPSISKSTSKFGVHYGSERRIVFQTPEFKANVLQHKFLPDALTLQKASTIDDLHLFSTFLDGIVDKFDCVLGGYQPQHQRGVLDYVTIDSETVVYGLSENLQPGDVCRVACLVALTGGWAKRNDAGQVQSRGLTFSVDEVKVYDLERTDTDPKIFINGLELKKQLHGKINS